MGITFVLITLTMIIMSLLKPQTSKPDSPAIIEVDTSLFKINAGFAFGSIIILGILAALYTVFW